MELEEAIQILKYQLANRNTDVYTPINYEAMEVVLTHLTKQEKMIQNLKKTMENDALSYVETQFVLDLIEESDKNVND